MSLYKIYVQPLTSGDRIVEELFVRQLHVLLGRRWVARVPRQWLGIGLGLGLGVRRTSGASENRRSSHGVHDLRVRICIRDRWRPESPDVRASGRCRSH